MALWNSLAVHHPVVSRQAEGPAVPITAATPGQLCSTQLWDFQECSCRARNRIAGCHLAVGQQKYGLQVSPGLAQLHIIRSELVRAYSTRHGFSGESSRQRGVFVCPRVRTAVGVVQIISTGYITIEFRAEFIMHINLTALVHMKNGVKMVVLNIGLDCEVSIWEVTPLLYSLRIHVSCAQELRNAHKPGRVDLSFRAPIPFSYSWCDILTAEATGETETFCYYDTALLERHEEIYM